MMEQSRDILFQTDFQRISVIICYFEDFSDKIRSCNTIFRDARIEIKHAILRFTNTNVLIGQFDLMKSYGYVGIFHCKLVAILIGNFPPATVMRTLCMYIYFIQIFLQHFTTK